MDFGISPRQRELQQRTRAFIADEVIPFESDALQTVHGPSDELRTELVSRARRAGLLTPHAAVGLGGLGFMLADSQMDLHVARLTIWDCAWLLDQGHKGRHESSVTKVICSEDLWRVADRSVQVLGGSGVTGETIVCRIYSDMRAFRIYDGPSEVHRWSIGNRMARGDSATLSAGSTPHGH